jgi:hypothetical protein
MKNIVIVMGLVMAAIFTQSTTAQAQSFTADSIKALKAENAALKAANAQLKEDNKAVTAVGQANMKGCGSLIINVAERTIEGFEPCNGWMLSAGAGYDFLKWKVDAEGTEGTTGSAIGILKVGYRYYWFRPEVSGQIGIGKQEVEGRQYTAAKFRAGVNIDFGMMSKVKHHHSVVNPYLYTGICYAVVMSAKETSLARLPYDGNNLRGELGIGAMIKLGTFRNGHITVNSCGEKVTLPKYGQLYLDLNLTGSYGTLSKPRLANDQNQPTMKNKGLTAMVTLGVKL